MKRSRPYQSLLREAHTEQTRERLVAAALQFLDSHEADTLTIPRVAGLAGVSAPTAYAHFPSLDALYLGIFQSLQPRLGMQVEHYPAELNRLPDIPGENFPAYARYRKALRALLLAPGFHRARRTNRSDRQRRWVNSVAAAIPELDSAAQRLGACAVNAFWTPTLWLWLTETCGLSTDEAIRLAAWAINTLVRGLKNNTDGLTSPTRRVPSDRRKRNPRLQKRSSAASRKQPRLQEGDS